MLQNRLQGAAAAEEGQRRSFACQGGGELVREPDKKHALRSSPRRRTIPLTSGPGVRPSAAIVRAATGDVSGTSRTFGRAQGHEERGVTSIPTFRRRGFHLVDVERTNSRDCHVVTAVTTGARRD